jgi:hypothetical protein
MGNKEQEIHIHSLMQTIIQVKSLWNLMKSMFVIIVNLPKNRNCQFSNDRSSFSTPYQLQSEGQDMTKRFYFIRYML